MNQTFALAFGGLALLAAANNQEWSPPTPVIKQLIHIAHPVAGTGPGAPRSAQKLTFDGLGVPIRMPVDLAAEAIWGAP
jgi:hypothetical protein